MIVPLTADGRRSRVAHRLRPAASRRHAAERRSSRRESRCESRRAVECRTSEPSAEPHGARHGASSRPSEYGGSDGRATGGVGGAGGARSGTGGHAFLDGCTGAIRAERPPTFGPPPDAHTLVIQGGAPTELSRSREIVGDRGRSWELSRLREAREGGALPNTPANSSLSSGAV